MAYREIDSLLEPLDYLRYPRHRPRCFRVPLPEVPLVVKSILALLGSIIYRKVKIMLVHLRDEGCYMDISRLHHSGSGYSYLLGNVSHEPEQLGGLQGSSQPVRYCSHWYLFVSLG